MKTCSSCKKQFPVENFAFKNKALGKRTSMCNDCRKERKKISYYKHHETNLSRIKQYKKDNKEWFFKLKSTLSCCVCGESDSSCLDFHHIDSNEKDFDISTKIESSKNKIMEEINKCACLCANCHRKYHAGKIFTPLVKLNITQSYEV
jgi:hypothetical protein